MKKLTRREIVVMQMISRGLTCQEVADALGRSQRTARAHVEHVREKLRARNSTHAVAKLFRMGVLE